MLVLARNVGETVYIGDNISVTINRVSKNGQVSLAFNAPKEVVIMREELKARIETSRVEAD